MENLDQLTTWQNDLDRRLDRALTRQRAGGHVADAEIDAIMAEMDAIGELIDEAAN